MTESPWILVETALPELGEPQTDEPTETTWRESRWVLIEDAWGDWRKARWTHVEGAFNPWAWVGTSGQDYQAIAWREMRGVPVEMTPAVAIRFAQSVIEADEKGKT